MSQQAGAGKSTYKNTSGHPSSRIPSVHTSVHPLMKSPNDEPQDHHDHRRFSYDELLETASTSETLDSDSELTDPDGLLGNLDANITTRDLSEGPSLPSQTAIPRRQQRRAFFIRTLALLCVCSLSIGSH